MRIKAQPSSARRARRVVANEAVEIAPEATELLFETEDVAEVVAEVTGEEVSVEVAGDVVELTVGEGEDAEVFTIEPEGDEEILEASTKVIRKQAVKASTRPAKRAVRRARR